MSMCLRSSITVTKLTIPAMNNYQRISDSNTYVSGNNGHPTVSQNGLLSEKVYY